MKEKKYKIFNTKKSLVQTLCDYSKFWKDFKGKKHKNFVFSEWIVERIQVVAPFIPEDRIHNEILPCLEVDIPYTEQTIKVCKFYQDYPEWFI
jgi:hypothetical protein